MNRLAGVKTSGVKKSGVKKSGSKSISLKSSGSRNCGPKKGLKAGGLAGGRLGRTQLEAMIARHGCTDFKWIDPKDIVVAEWVRMKCRFGCSGFGRNASCPPNVPDVDECRRFFDSYSTGIVYHFTKGFPHPKLRHAWSTGITREMLKLEREVFLAGCYKVFLLPMDSCGLCARCPGVRELCKLPALARPSPEAMAVDVYATARQYGYPIEVLEDYLRAMNRYGFLLIE
jgi:predicted metal-binding protein